MSVTLIGLVIAQRYYIIPFILSTNPLDKSIEQREETRGELCRRLDIRKTVIQMPSTGYLREV